MRILMSADAVGGVWTYALDLAQALAPYGIEIHLAVMGSEPQPHQWQDAQAIPNLVLHMGPYKLEWMDSPWDDVRRAGDWLRRLAVRLQPNLVHLNGYAHAALDFEVPVIVVAHSCVFSWWHAVKGCSPPARYKRYQQYVENGLQSATQVIAPTYAMLCMLHQHYCFTTPQQVIPNGVQTGLYTPSQKTSMVFSVGRTWDEAKNIAALERIAANVPYPVYVAGTEHAPDGARTRMKNINALGFLSRYELRQWYSRSPVYVLPAFYEPFGLSVLEAALSGCALVLGEVATLYENWAGIACFVPPGDDTALLATVQHLLHSPEEQAQRGWAAQRHAQQFSRENMAQQYLSIYKEMLNEDHLILPFSGVGLESR